jgi:glucose/arabinose dehydrogenase
MLGALRRGRQRRGVATLTAAWLAAASVLGAPITHLTPPAQVQAAGLFADAHFREFTTFSGLTKPVSVRFASDGRAFVAEKGGVVKAFDSVADTTPTTVIDLSADIQNYWDRGLLGLAIDPGFLDVANPRPYLYLYYVYDAPPGGTAPVWGDTCPNPPGGTGDGCVVTSRLDRITVDPGTNTAVPGSRVQLLHDWCQQFPSHSGGGLAFGPDGQLYLSTGDGASFNGSDYGQLGGTRPDPVNPVTPVNPCGDPAALLAPDPATGKPVTEVATAEGGQLRSQDVRTAGDPTGLDGTLIRIDPDTGLGSAGNPLASSADANDRRIIAHGFRNPFRWTFRPGTNEIYLGDVGNQTWEEIERVILPTTALTRTTLPNFGWPCYEGVARSGLQALGLNLCTGLYSQSGAVTSPLYQYSHGGGPTPTGPCFVPDPTNGKMGSSVTGLAFYQGAGTGSAPYPARYDGALFFADYSRNCLAVMLAGPDGTPDATTVETVATGIAHPVDLLTGPGGDLFYVDIDGGRVVRIRHLVQPIARGSATPAVSTAPVIVTLDASASSDPDPTSTLTAWNWDLDHDGTFDGPNDKTGQVVTWDVATKGVYPVTLQVVSSNGLTDTAELVVDASNAPPVPSIDTPDPSLTWAVGDTISFSGSATDPEDGVLPASALSWDIVMMHCPADCHEHVIQTNAGVASGSFDAPDHEYPSHLALRLTVTDSHGTSATATIELQPKTSVVAADSSPAGVPLFVGGAERPSPSEVTVIRNGQMTVSAPPSAMIGGRLYKFSAWSDGLPRTHDITAGTARVDLVATFVADAPDTCASATLGSTVGSWIPERAGGNGDQDWFRFTLTSTRG